MEADAIKSAGKLPTVEIGGGRGGSCRGWKSWVVGVGPCAVFYVQDDRDTRRDGLRGHFKIRS